MLAIGLALDLVALGITVHTRTNHPQVAAYDYLSEAAYGGIPPYRIGWCLGAVGVSGACPEARRPRLQRPVDDVEGGVTYRFGIGCVADETTESV